MVLIWIVDDISGRWIELELSTWDGLVCAFELVNWLNAVVHCLDVPLLDQVTELKVSLPHLVELTNFIQGHEARVALIVVTNCALIEL